MTTPAQGNLSQGSTRPEPAFELSGLSPEEADRLAASFKPSWEFDEAPFAHASPLSSDDLEPLESGGVNSDVRAYVHARHAGDAERSQSVAPHSPPPRLETNEPEVSVIIDRSITANELAGRPPAPPTAVTSPFAAQMAAAVAAPNRVIAPVARSRMNADESLELPASLKKSNKGLFLGMGAAALAAVLVFAVRAVTSSGSDEPSPTVAATAPTVDSPRVSPPATPSIPAAAATSVPAVPPPAVSPPAVIPVTPLPAPTPIVHAAAVQAPKPAPHTAAPPPHHAPAPRAQPKPSSGGIVRDNPF